MSINFIDGLTFDDVLLIPKYSKINSRASVDLSVKLSKGLRFKHPIIPANMKTVTGAKMAKLIAESGGLSVLHRFISIEEQLEIVNEFVLMTKEGTPDYLSHVGVSVGVKKEDYENVNGLYQLGARIFCIDVAHGDSDKTVSMTNYIRNQFNHNVFIIAGNVAGPEGARNLWAAGADCVKVGVGPGSLCTTRIETGNGVPQLTALESIWSACKALPKPLYVIADGGIKNAGDMVKALCFSDMVMAGNLFAGTDETPGEIVQVDGKRYKNYVGSSTHRTNHIEGVMALVPTKGPADSVLLKLCEGIRSGLSYQGCNNLNELKIDPKFVRITNAGLTESHPHDVKVI